MNRSVRFGTFPRHHHRSRRRRRAILKRLCRLQSATTREVSLSCCGLRTSAEVPGMACQTTTPTTRWRCPLAICGLIPHHPIYRCSCSRRTTICCQQTVSSNRPWNRWELHHWMDFQTSKWGINSSPKVRATTCNCFPKNFSATWTWSISLIIICKEFKLRWKKNSM